MLGRTDYSATQRRRATIFRPATAAAHLTYDRHISERQSLNTIFTRVNPSIRINCVQRAVVTWSFRLKLRHLSFVCKTFTNWRFCKQNFLKPPINEDLYINSMYIDETIGEVWSGDWGQMWRCDVDNVSWPRPPDTDLQPLQPRPRGHVSWRPWRPRQHTWRSISVPRSSGRCCDLQRHTAESTTIISKKQ